MMIMEEKNSHSPQLASEPQDTASDIDALGLDSDQLHKVKELLHNAKAEGYLRGRNEKIEATQHFSDQPDTPTDSTPFPAYSHRSVWDCG